MALADFPSIEPAFFFGIIGEIPHPAGCGNRGGLPLLADERIALLLFAVMLTLLGSEVVIEQRARGNRRNAALRSAAQDMRKRAKGLTGRASGFAEGAKLERAAVHYEREAEKQSTSGKWAVRGVWALRVTALAICLQAQSLPRVPGLLPLEHWSVWLALSFGASRALSRAAVEALSASA